MAFYIKNEKNKLLNNRFRLRETLDVSGSVFSKHLKSLEEANCVLLTKRKGMPPQRTWPALSADGRTAYSGQVKVL